MSTIIKLILLAASAAFAGQGYNEVPMPRKITKPSKGEAKKCKSCTYFPCATSRKPKRIACGKYEKKKK